MQPISICGFTYDPFPGGHYIHSFHDQTWEYYENEGKEHPRTVRFPFSTPKHCGLTGKRCWCEIAEIRIVRSFERHLGRTQLVRKDQGPHPRREMDTRGVGPAKRRVLDPATRKEDGDYTSGLHTGMGLTSFKD